MSALLIAGLCALWFGLGFWAGMAYRDRPLERALDDSLTSTLRRIAEHGAGEFPCDCQKKEAPRG